MRKQVIITHYLSKENLSELYDALKHSDIKMFSQLLKKYGVYVEKIKKTNTHTYIILGVY